MAFNPKQLYQGLLPAGTTTAYTVPSGKTVIVKEILVCNVSVGAVTYDLHLVKSGDTVGTANQILKGASVAASATSQLNFSQPLEAGATIQIVPSSGDALCVTISGVEVS